MKTLRCLFPVLSVLAVVLTGCEVECEFTKKIDGHAKHSFEECHAEIVICESSGCTDEMKIKCGHQLVYRGPYTLSTRNAFIIYTATNWEGKGDVPFIRTEPPISSLTALSEEADENGFAPGYCRYPRTLPFGR